ncbi:hypothetical protein HKX48_007929 [Thoreauomyces humboldtii]|nr:hypothetical protein HKX48_007929 [Thoreauomyces humboldtii]
MTGRTKRIKKQQRREHEEWESMAIASALVGRKPKTSAPAAIAVRSTAIETAENDGFWNSFGQSALWTMVLVIGAFNVLGAFGNIQWNDNAVALNQHTSSLWQRANPFTGDERFVQRVPRAAVGVVTSTVFDTTTRTQTISVTAKGATTTKSVEVDVTKTVTVQGPTITQTATVTQTATTTKSVEVDVTKTVTIQGPTVTHTATVTLTAKGSTTTTSVEVDFTKTTTVQGPTVTKSVAPVTITQTVNQPTPTSTTLGYVVGTDGKSKFSTIQAAINGVPQDGSNVTIWINPGTYNEQVIVNRSHTTIRPVPNVTGKVVVQFNFGRPTSDGLDNTTSVLTIPKKITNVDVYDMTFQNTYMQQKSVVGLALNVNGLQIGFYGVSFIGFQDTILINKPSASFFKNCYIEGSVDFIWGYGQAYFLNSTIASNAAGCVTAHSKAVAGDSNALVFDSCTVKAVYPATLAASANAAIVYTSATNAVGQAYLGRPYDINATVVYMNSYLGNVIDSDGWQPWSTTTTNVGSTTILGEYNSTGPGAVGPRVSWAIQFDDTTVAPYRFDKFWSNVGTTWIDSGY